MFLSVAKIDGSSFNLFLGNLFHTAMLKSCEKHHRNAVLDLGFQQTFWKVKI